MSSTSTLKRNYARRPANGSRPVAVLLALDSECQRLSQVMQTMSLSELEYYISLDKTVPKEVANVVSQMYQFYVLKNQLYAETFTPMTDIATELFNRPALLDASRQAVEASEKPENQEAYQNAYYYGYA